MIHSLEKLFVAPGLAITALLGVSAQRTLETGQIVLGIILAVGTIAGVVYGVRWRTAYEVEAKVSEGLKQLFEMKDAESKVLHATLLDTKDIVAKQGETIARLEQLPNLERILQMMGDMAIKQDAAADRRLEIALQHTDQINEQHEERVVARHELTLAVLTRIEQRLLKEVP